MNATKTKPGILCPICSEVVHRFDSDGRIDADGFTPSCDHLEYLWLDCDGGFEFVSEEVQKFLDGQGEDFDPFEFVSTPNKFAEIIVEHEERGCDNHSISGFYGFRK